MDQNIALKEINKLGKYKDLATEIERMWNLKPCIIPVVIGALGMIKKGTASYVMLQLLLE